MRRLLIVLLLVLALGPWLAPYDPVAQDRAAAHTGPGMKHLLGTDNYGRDLLSRFLAGGSWSILVGLLATAVVLALGLCIGGFAGFKGGWIDAVLMRIGDLFLSLPWLAPYDPVAQDRAAAHTGPGMKHLLGTDNYGRDLLSRFLAGGSWSILVGLLATAVVLALGLCIGGFAGFKGGWIDAVLMRIGDLFLSLPWLYALIGLRALMPLTMKPRAAVVTLLLVIALVSWARPARLIRGIVLSQITRGYVDAARGFGVPEWRVFRDHVMPATYSVLGAQALVLFPRFVLAEVTLSFLGLGVGAPEPSWGELILGLKEPYLLTEQWWRMLPIALMVPFFLLCAREARRFASMKSTPSVSSKCTT